MDTEELEYALDSLLHSHMLFELSGLPEDFRLYRGARKEFMNSLQKCVLSAIAAADNSSEIRHHIEDMVRASALEKY